MFDLVYTEEIKAYLRTIRKGLRAKDYKQVKSRTNRKIGTIVLDYNYEYFIKDDLIFEFEIDNYNGMIKTRLHYYGNGQKEQKEILLSEVLELC